VLEGGKLAGIVSVGDLARPLDPTSMWADLSVAPSNV
jgi:hypothetical protein